MWQMRCCHEDSGDLVRETITFNTHSQRWQRRPKAPLHIYKPSGSLPNVGADEDLLPLRGPGSTCDRGFELRGLSRGRSLAPDRIAHVMFA